MEMELLKLCALLAAGAAGAATAAATPSDEPAVISLASAAGQSWSLTGRGPHGDVRTTAATVPGDITYDMLAAGRLGVQSLWYGDNARESPWWVPLTEWTYETAVRVPASVGDDGPPGMALSAALSFAGCDYNCSVSLDGVPLGNHTGSFVGFEYDATTIMAQAANNGRDTIPLRVVLHVPPDFGDFSVSSIYNGSKQFPLQMYGTEKCAENRFFTMWKGQMNRWDFAPPFWQLGLWRNVSLVLRRHAPVTLPAHALAVRTLLPDGADGGAPHTAVLSVSAALHSTAAVLSYQRSSKPLVITIEWEVWCWTDPSAPRVTVNTSHSVEMTAKGADVANATLHLPSPRLWWPTGYGRQDMYLLRASLYVPGSSSSSSSSSGDGSEDAATWVLADQSLTKFGVRQLANTRNPGPAWWMTNQYEHGSSCNGPCHLNSSAYPQGPRSADDYYEPDRWQFVINGRKVFARGGNWVPGDMAYGALVHDQKRYRSILRAAKLAGYTYITTSVSKPPFGHLFSTGDSGKSV